MFYFADALVNGALPVLVHQLINDMAVAGSTGWRGKIDNTLKIHRLFFHTLDMALLSVAAILVVAASWRRVRREGVFWFFLFAFLGYAVINNRITKYYFLLFMPFLVLLLVAAWHEAAARFRDHWRFMPRLLAAVMSGLVILGLGASGKFVRANMLQVLPLPERSRMLARHLDPAPDRAERPGVLAPKWFFFDEIERFRIHGLTLYAHANPATGQLWTIEELMQHAHTGLDVSFVIFERRHPGQHQRTAMFLPPDETEEHYPPGYQRIYRDAVYEIYAWREDSAADAGARR